MTEKQSGRIITAPISALRQIHCDEIWQITRVNSEIKGTVWVPELAPSQALFNQYLKEWKGQPPEKWWPLYEKRFNQELQSQGKMSVLRKLREAPDAKKNIALVCFCPEYQYCHRRLVGQCLEKYGMKVEEINVPVSKHESPRQLELF